tara:strand:- start:2650 stop:3093 length:444 start_codon:yes stop_codon:yes gene_type:complete
MKNEIHDQSILSEKQIQRLEARLYKVQGAINHWNTQKNQAEYFLEERTKEKGEIESKLSYSRLASSLFAECEKIDPSECDTYDVIEHVEGIKGTKNVEVHKCKATGWHYLFFPEEKEYPYYCCIARDDAEFKTLEELQEWARPLYFQ